MYSEILNNEVWATLKPSPIHGIGVFAIRDIPKGAALNRASRDFINSIEPTDYYNILPCIRKLIEQRNSDPLSIFEHPNRSASLSAFMNHSENPNTRMGYHTLSFIKEGEELTENYRELRGIDMELILSIK